MKQNTNNNDKITKPICAEMCHPDCEGQTETIRVLVKRKNHCPATVNVKLSSRKIFPWRLEIEAQIVDVFQCASEYTTKGANSTVRELLKVIVCFFRKSVSFQVFLQPQTLLCPKHQQLSINKVLFLHNYLHNTMF